MLRPAPILVLAAAIALSGCGKSETKAAAPVAEKAIYMSSADCAEGGKLSADACTNLIERAVQMHETQSQAFKGIRSCEEASGVDRCEKTAGGTYRMRLQAFMFEIIGKEAQATPLYPSIEGKIGFRDAKKAAVDARDDNLIVSQASLTLAHENAKIAKAGRR